MVKMDMLHMLYQRHVLMNWTGTVSRFLMPDSSPQSNYDYLAVIEERLWRPSPYKHAQPFDPFKGFRWERRAMPYMTIGRGEGSLATKLDRMVHTICLEAGQNNLPSSPIFTDGHLALPGLYLYRFAGYCPTIVHCSIVCCVQMMTHARTS
jgi:hypothetical protein